MTLAGDPGLLTSQGQWEDLFVWYDEQRGVRKMIMHAGFWRWPGGREH